MRRHKILLVEDEKNFGIVMRDYLRMNGYEVTHCEDGLTGLAHFHKAQYDLSILDIMMPGMDGFMLAEEIRKQNAEMPIVFLTARTMREDMLRGYHLGADDYINKPFDPEVLLWKLKTILKRNKLDDAPMEALRFSEFIYLHQERLLKHDSGQEVRLSPKESLLFHMLLVNKNTVVNKSTLLQKIWKADNYFTGRSMDVYIVKLRKYLESDKMVRLENIHGSGYCLKEQ
jgi:two-component system, OmpR family, response regulator